MDMARFEIPVSGWTCLRTMETRQSGVDHTNRVRENSKKMGVMGLGAEALCSADAVFVARRKCRDHAPL